MKKNDNPSLGTVIQTASSGILRLGKLFCSFQAAQQRLSGLLLASWRRRVVVVAGMVTWSQSPHRLVPLYSDIVNSKFGSKFGFIRSLFKIPFQSYLVLFLMLNSKFSKFKLFPLSFICLGKAGPTCTDSSTHGLVACKRPYLLVLNYI